MREIRLIFATLNFAISQIFAFIEKIFITKKCKIIGLQKLIYAKFFRILLAKINPTKVVKVNLAKINPIKIIFR